MTKSDQMHKLYIARLAYKEVKAVMDKYENSLTCHVSFCWDGCIRVDDELFHEHQLRESNE